MKRLLTVAACLSCLFMSSSFGGLVHYYTLDGHALDVIDGWNGTANNTSASANRFGNVGKAMYFNGSNAYVHMPDFRSLLNFDKDWSLNAWARASTGVQSGAIFGGGDGGSGAKQFFFSPISNRATSSADSAADWHIVDWDRYHHDPLGDGAWHMYTLTWDNAGAYTFYVDGVLFEQDTVGSLTDFYPDTYLPVLGAGNSGFLGSITGHFAGDLDDFQIYDHTLSPDEIGNIVNPVPVPSSLLLGFIGLSVTRWRLRRGGKC